MIYTDAEMVARIDDTLAHTADHTYETDEQLDAGWTADETFAAELAETTSIDTPVGAHGNWREIAEAAWETLTGDTELPDWFDELATVTEMARRSGREPSEVREALDTALAPTWQMQVEAASLHSVGIISTQALRDCVEGSESLDDECGTGVAPSPGCSATVVPITISPGEWSWCTPDPALVSPLVDLADQPERVQAMGVETVPVVPDEGLLIVSAPTVRTVETPWRRLRAMGLALPALPHRR